MNAYEVTVTVRGTREEVEARVARALRDQGFVLRGGEPHGEWDRYDLVRADPGAGSQASGEVVVGETGGLVTVSVHERASVEDVVDAAAAARGAALAPARVRLRAALASLAGEP
jgi:hypothetical protein